MADISIPSELMSHLVRFGVTGDTRQFIASARRYARKLKREGHELGEEIMSLASEVEQDPSPALRRARTERPLEETSMPFFLINIEKPEVSKPTLPKSVQKEISTLILEQQESQKLLAAGLEPAKSALFVGPPGVGKTMSANWIAMQLGLPLLVLNLATTVSSLYGQTGNNLREALQYARKRRCVLLIDEFDSIAKGRNEEDIGEAKRLVTVLLQEMDLWPSHSILLAATNHGELLDRAIWRRFDANIEFPLASYDTARLAASLAFNGSANEDMINLVAHLMDGKPLSSITALVKNARKNEILFDEKIEDYILRSALKGVDTASRSEAFSLAEALVASGISQRKASALTGVSRDTLRKKLKDKL